MGKAINAFIEKQAESSKKQVTLHVLQRYHPKGGYEKTVVIERTQQPTEKVVTEVREVKYLYDGDKVSYGTEIVKEETFERGNCVFPNSFQPKVVGQVIRDLRDPNYVPPKKRYNSEE